MPEPKRNEIKQDFASRCIADLTGKEKSRLPKSSRWAAIRHSRWGETSAEKERAARKK